MTRNSPACALKSRQHAAPGESCGGVKTKFAGFIQKEKSLFLVGVRSVKTPYGERFVHLRVPVSASFISSLAPDLGPVEFQLLEPLEAANQKVLAYTLNSRDFQVAVNIIDRRRLLRPPQGFWDTDVTGVTRFDAKYEYSDGRVDSARPVVAIFTTRPSHLNVRMFSSVGDLGLVYVTLWAFLPLFFFCSKLPRLLLASFSRAVLLPQWTVSTTQRYSSRTATIRIASKSKAAISSASSASLSIK